MDGDNSTWWQFPPISTANSYIPVHIQVNLQRIFMVNTFKDVLIAILNYKFNLNLNNNYPQCTLYNLHYFNKETAS